MSQDKLKEWEDKIIDMSKREIRWENAVIDGHYKGWNVDTYQDGARLSFWGYDDNNQHVRVDLNGEILDYGEVRELVAKTAEEVGDVDTAMRMFLPGLKSDGMKESLMKTLYVIAVYFKDGRQSVIRVNKELYEFLAGLCTVHELKD